MNYYDVVIRTNKGCFDNESEFQSAPPVDERIPLSQGVWIEKLDDELATSIMEVCEPAWLGQSRPSRLSSQLYTFVRELEPANHPVFHWDEDHRLLGTIGLSRLIHPTRVGFVYAARVQIEEGRLTKAVPAKMAGVSREAFISPAQKRDWLTREEVIELARIAPKVTGKLAPRIHKALWFHEYSARSYYLDVRWTLVCVGLEPLIHTDEHRSTEQFKLRVAALAQEVGVSLSVTEAHTGYTLRSEVVHSGFLLANSPSQAPQSDQVSLYDKLEDVLRKSVLRSFHDPSFAAVFVNDAMIKNRWPV